MMIGRQKEGLKGVTDVRRKETSKQRGKERTLGRERIIMKRR